MKKLFLSLAAVLGLLSMNSCGNDEYEVHQTFFFPLTSEGTVAYADQLSDTIRLYSLDSWTLKTTDTWLTATPNEASTSNGKAINTLITFGYEANTTGHPRRAYAQAYTFDVITRPVTQYSWLNIRRPAAITTNVGEVQDIKDMKVAFPMDLKYTAADTSVVFTVYQDNATLKTTDEWIHLAGETFDAGDHTVKVRVDANNGTTARNGVIRLTSGGISTDILVRQGTEKE